MSGERNGGTLEAAVPAGAMANGGNSILKLRIRDSQGFTLGLIFVALAVFVVVTAQGYRPGTATNMGPGYFPRLLGGALFVVGVLVLMFACRVDGPRMEWRSCVRPTLVLGTAIVVFSVAVKSLGAILATAILVVIASLASQRPRWREILISAVIIAAICAAVFVAGLGMQVPLWPWSPA